MFKVHNTEELLQTKLSNLFEKLQRDHGVSAATIKKMESYMLTSDTTLTAFCRKHLVSHHPVDTKVLSDTLVNYAGIQSEGAIDLVQTYLNMFSALVL